MLIFDKDGRLRTVVGREGSGPGEFRSVGWMGRIDDSILVFDVLASRFTVLDPVGRFARMFGAPVGAFPVGFTAEGSIVVVQAGAYDPRTVRGVVRDTISIVRLSPAGEARDTVVRVPGAEWFVYEAGRSFRAIRLPFGAQAHVAMANDTLIIGENMTGQFVAYSATAEILRRFTVPLAARRVTEAEVARELEFMRDPQQRALLGAEMRKRRQSLPAPLLAELRIDTDGNVWIRAYAPAGADSATWLVTNAAGALLGRLNMAITATPLAIRRDQMLLNEVDGDGTETLVLRRIVRP